MAGGEEPPRVYAGRVVVNSKRWYLVPPSHCLQDGLGRNDEGDIEMMKEPAKPNVRAKSLNN